MKKLIFIIPCMLIIGGCANLNQLQTSYQDDLYYIPGENTQIVQPQQKDNQQLSNLKYNFQVNNENINQDSSSIANNQQNNSDTSYRNQYEPDDYYDYEYAARIRRFHRPYYYDYYDSYYTNLYWYTYDPFDYGFSIYLGYNWWHPYSFGFYWNYPYSWYSPSYAYWAGYQHGFYDGYWYGYYNDVYYYNSFDGTANITYGPRRGVSTNGIVTGTRTSGTRSHFVKVYEEQTNSINLDNNIPVNPNSGRTRISGNYGSATNSFITDPNSGHSSRTRVQPNVTGNQPNSNIQPDNNSNDKNGRGNRTRNLSNTFPDTRNQAVTTSPDAPNQNNNNNNNSNNNTYRPSYSVPRSQSRQIYNNPSNDRPMNNNNSNNNNNNLRNNSNQNRSFQNPSSTSRPANHNTGISNPPRSSGNSSGSTSNRKR